MHDAHLYMDTTWCTNIIHWLVSTWQERLAGKPMHPCIMTSWCQANAGPLQRHAKKHWSSKERNASTGFYTFWHLPWEPMTASSSIILFFLLLELYPFGILTFLSGKPCFVFWEILMSIVQHSCITSSASQQIIQEKMYDALHLLCVQITKGCPGD